MQRVQYQKRWEMMARINSEGYVERRIKCCKKNPAGKATYRSWFFIKTYQIGFRVGARLGPFTIHFPKKYIGKKIQIKVEVLE